MFKNNLEKNLTQNKHSVNASDPPATWASQVTQWVKNLSAMQETQIQFWVGKIPWRRAWQPTPVLPGESHGQRSLVGYHSWVRRVGHN